MDVVAKRGEEEGRAERREDKSGTTGSVFVSYTSFCVC